MSSLEGNGKPGLGSWNKEARADSGLYRVREAAVAADCNCTVRARCAPPLSVLLGMRLGYFGACLCSPIRGSFRYTSVHKPPHCF